MRHKGGGGGGGGGLRELVGAIKDKASQTRATLQPPSPYQLPLLRSTTHSPTAPPSLRHLSYLLTLSNSSRSSASSLVSSLMDRLRHTRSSPVALKCLFSFHFFLRHGPFILLDQLSFLPLLGGRNYLNLSSFRDSSSPLSWDLSAWVRWYASYLERAVSSCRALGHHFLNSSSAPTTPSPLYDESKVSSFANHDLLLEIESLAGLIEETSRIPDSCLDNPIVRAVKEYVMDDCTRVVRGVSIRVNEFGERIELLSFADSVELVCTLRRLEACEGRVVDGEEGSSRVWDSIRALRGKVGCGGVGDSETRKVVWSESARFEVGRRLHPRLSDLVLFPSGRRL